MTDKCPLCGNRQCTCPVTVQISPYKLEPITVITHPSRLEIASRIMAGMLSAVYSNKEMLNEFLTDSSKGYLQHVTGHKAFTENALSYTDALIKAYKESGGEDPNV